MIERFEDRWTQYRWRLIRGEPVAAPVNHAIDEVLTRAVGTGRREPTLRFWDRLQPEVVIGRFQSVRNEVNEDAASELDIPVTRRITGGGAMYVEVPNVIEPINDITSSGGKIGGAAQARRFGAVLHHTTMSYDINSDRMLRVLRIGKEKLSDKGIASAAKRVGPLRLQTQLPRQAIIDRMIDEFANSYGLSDDQITEGELSAAQDLATYKYATPEWTFAVP